MATVKDIERRVRSVRNTRKVTRALELVAAAKLKRAQSRIEDMRPYADRMLELMAGTARASSSVRGLPLLQKREQEQAVAIVPLTGDRGLAGAFNSQILRRAIALERELRGEGKQVRWVGVGRRGVGSLRFRRFELAGEFTGFTDQPRYADAQAIAHRVAELYTQEEVDRVVLVYNHFESVLVQKVTVHRARADPGAAPGGLHRDRALPGPPGIRRFGARRANDGDEKRLEERRGAHRQPHPRHEPGPSGRDHPGNSGGRGRSGRAQRLGTASNKEGGPNVSQTGRGMPLLWQNAPASRQEVGWRKRGCVSQSLTERRE